MLRDEVDDELPDDDYVSNPADLAVEGLPPLNLTRVRRIVYASGFAQTTDEAYAREVDPKSPSELEIRDPADRWILASALAARVDVLVTGDRDLLVIAPDAPSRIVDPRGFWELARKQKPAKTPP